MTRDDDIRDAQIHGAIDTLAQKVASTFGLTWREMLERLVCFAENDEHAPCFTVSAGKPRKRPRRVREEARA